MHKHKNIILLLTVLFSSQSFAGNQLSQLCKTDFYKNNVKVSGLNVSTRTIVGFGINVKIDGEWGVMKMKESRRRSRDIAYDIAKLAYLTNATVNACIGNGYLTGIELIEK
ncbi:hypothetical protein [Psychromonas aquimarina]|uniref:hypothetical protein n=1 Tax=Psychromonas aquimarina TaxID=444919 RepID=UPI00048FCC22|nr:hypothetical protein [Psychromonas aquimarina]